MYAFVCKEDVFCLMFSKVNTHLTPRPILLTRHGESRDNVRGRIGGDTALRFAFQYIKNKFFDSFQWNFTIYIYIFVGFNVWIFLFYLFVFFFLFMFHLLMSLVGGKLWVMLYTFLKRELIKTDVVFILFSPSSDAGELYSRKLANFVEKRLKNERAASVSFIITSNLSSELVWGCYFTWLTSLPPSPFLHLYGIIIASVAT